MIFFSAVSFQTLNKNNLLPDERSNFYQTPLQQANVYTTTYYPTALGKYDYQPNSSPSPCRTYNNSNNSWDTPHTWLSETPLPTPQTDTIPMPRWHNCTDMNWNVSQSSALCSASPLYAPSPVSSAWWGLCLQGHYWNFPSGDVGLDDKALVHSGGNQLGGVCYCKGYSSVNSELHVGTWWKTSAGQLMALDRMLWPEHLEQLQFWRQTWAEPFKNIYYIPLDLGHHFTPFYYEPHSQPVMNSESIDNKSTENKQCISLCPAWCAAREQQQRSKLIKAD